MCCLLPILLSVQVACRHQTLEAWVHLLVALGVAKVSRSLFQVTPKYIGKVATKITPRRDHQPGQYNAYIYTGLDSTP